MRTIFILSYLLPFILITACGGGPQTTAEEETNSTKISTKKTSPKTKPIVLEQPDSIEATSSIQDSTEEEYADDLYYIPDGTVTGIFEDATVYAASTDFSFTIKGKTKLIRVDNEEYFEMEEGNEIVGYEIPSDLIDPSDDVEGPPGGNPKYIGKKFEITINDDLLKIKLMN